MLSQQKLHFRIVDEIYLELSEEANFPTCLDAATLVRNTLNDPESTLAKVVLAVSAEPLISSKVLRLANSAAHNVSGCRITELGSAINRLGFEIVRTFSIAVVLDQILRTSQSPPFAPLAKLTWEHSLQVAVIARVLARHIGGIHPDEAMQAGLVRHIGVFYLLYRAAKKPEYAVDESLLIDLLKTWEQDIGKRLSHALGLSESIAQTLNTPGEQATDGQPANLRDLLNLAETLANAELPWKPATENLQNEAFRLAQRTQYAPFMATAQAEIDELTAALAT